MCTYPRVDWDLAHIV
jgi:hypothetical protein